MRKITTVFLLLFATMLSAQIKGTITDAKGTALPAVSVFIENTYNGTSSNENGSYELNIKKLKEFFQARSSCSCTLRSTLWCL
jgi:hypothetical protein